LDDANEIKIFEDESLEEENENYDD